MKRLALQPEDVGLSRDSNRRRRAPGLRREEVAALAAISTDYYARIEQGRRGAPWPTLETIAGNAMAAALMVTDFDQLLARQRNYVRMVFTDSAVRRLYPDWEETGRLC